MKYLVIYDDRENHKPIGICATKEDAQDLILSMVEEKEYNKVMADGFEHFNKIYNHIRKKYGPTCIKNLDAWYYYTESLNYYIRKIGEYS